MGRGRSVKDQNLARSVEVLNQQRRGQPACGTGTAKMSQSSSIWNGFTMVQQVSPMPSKHQM
jgi:hypothetical protein